eukprot:tig00000367_g24451.t1
MTEHAHKSSRTHWVAFAVALLVGVLAAGVHRAMNLPTRQEAIAEHLEALVVDPGKQNAVAERLAAALKFQTVSSLAYEDHLGPSARAMTDLHKYLKKTYWRAHRELKVETVAGHSLLFTWQGSDRSLKPVLLMAHLDVVPVAPGTEAEWKYGAFDGKIAEGHVWGRGAIDSKVGVICILEAVEELLQSGFKPARTVYLAFGHDEEVSGTLGAKAISAKLQAEGVQLEFVLDEGSTILSDYAQFGVQGRAAQVAIAEKGMLNVELSVSVAAGHAARPPLTGTAIGILSAAIARIEAAPMRPRLVEPTTLLFDALAPEAPGLLQRLALSNVPLIRPLLERFMVSDQMQAAMVRSTCTPTIFHAGVKENVLPGRAAATINCRILPGATSGDILAHVRAAVGDERVNITALSTWYSEPSPSSPVDGAPYRLLARTVREVYGRETLVLPILMYGATDSRHYNPLSTSVFKFYPLMYPGELNSAAHGSNERIPVESLYPAVAFYARLLNATTHEVQHWHVPLELRRPSS